MKASTLFGLTFALLMGLGVVVAARVTGFLDAKPAIDPPKKETNGLPMLIAARNLYRGANALESDAKVRPMTDKDHEMYDKYRDKMLAPIPSGIEYRKLKVSVAAGTPLMEDMFEPIMLPEQLSATLSPHTRAVNVMVQKPNVAGGLPRVGEYVDVLLAAYIRQNSGVSGAAPMEPFTATAIISRKLKIIAKRDSLYTLNIPNPVDQPLSYVLEANPYRAALIEYAKSRGKLTLQLIAPTNLANAPEPMVDPDSREYRDEDKRVREFMNNEHTITDSDLERIFNLRTRPTPIQPVAAQPPEMMIGLVTHTVYNTGAGWRSGPAKGPLTASGAPVSVPFQSQNSFTFGPISPTPRPGGNMMATDYNLGEKAKCETCGHKD